MKPYELSIETVTSGFAAIEKIKDGNVYDVVFMDHMMPKMDGMETTKIIRDMGYKHAIVALTANAVAGQFKVFLKNGFDDFISKPIDMRQMNAVLNKLIRDKQPPNVIEAARRQKGGAQKQSDDEAQLLLVNPLFLEVFVRDASKTIAVLEMINEKRGVYSENDIRMYAINVHGIKSALANIGQKDLSAFALKLEQASRTGNIEVVSSETPAFLGSLRALVEENMPKEDGGGFETAEDDQAFLQEKLLEIKAACEAYNKKTAKYLIAELRGKTSSQEARELLDTIAGHLLHSDFNEAVSAADKFAGSRQSGSTEL
jgi:CheY-like chemotaxis protein